MQEHEKQQQAASLSDSEQKRSTPEITGPSGIPDTDGQLPPEQQSELPPELPPEQLREHMIASSVNNAETLDEALQEKDYAQIRAAVELEQRQENAGVEYSAAKTESGTASAAYSSSTDAAAADGASAVHESEAALERGDIENKSPEQLSRMLQEVSQGNAGDSAPDALEIEAEAVVNAMADEMVSLNYRQQQAAQVGVEAAAPIVVATNEHALDAAKMAAMMTAEAGGDQKLQGAAAVAAAAAAAGNSGIGVDVTSRSAMLNENASRAEINKVADVVDDSISRLDLHEPQRSLLSLTWPIFIDLSLHFATLIINTIMVGMVSVKAVAELTIGNQVFDLALIIFNFFNIGVCVVCAQALGANNKRLARRIIHVGLGVNLIVGTIVSLSIFMLSGFIVDIMQVPEEIAASSHNYLKILSLSFLPLSICLVGSAILRAHNCTRDAMYVSLLINVITICGNSLFLFGYFGVPVLGVEGVALSTVVGRAVACFVFIPLIVARTRTHIIPRFMFVFRKKVIASILSIGLPGAGENLSWHTQYMFMTGVIASMGAMQLATQGIYFQIIQVLMLCSASIGMGTELLVAHYTGALKLDLANRQLIRSVKIGEVLTILLTFSMPLGTGAFLVSCFTRDPEVMAIASTLFIITVFQEPGRILNVIIINSLRATGDTKFPVLMAVISMWGISVPLGCFLGVYLDWGLMGVWLGFTADEWFRGIAMVLRWRSKAWEKSARRVYEHTLAMESHRSRLKSAAEAAAS